MFPGLLPIFLRGCVIKSGSGLGTRLDNLYFLRYIITFCLSLTLAGASLPSGSAGISVPPHPAVWRRPPPGPRRLWNETQYSYTSQEEKMRPSSLFLTPRLECSDYNTGIKMIRKWTEEHCYYRNSLNNLHGQSILLYSGSCNSRKCPYLEVR